MPFLPIARCRASVRNTSCRPGFTLGELLVVLTVIALLAGLLAPVLAQARTQARQTACLSNLRQIAQAQLLYMQDWDERFPDWYWFSQAPSRPAPFGPYVYWTEFFQPYLHSPQLLQDPGGRWPWTLPKVERLAEYTLGTWGEGGLGTAALPHWRWPGSPFTLACVRRPAETISVMDGWTTTSKVGGWTGLDLYRHREGMNVSFVDGHARWLAAGAFWRVDTDGRGFYWRHYGTVDR